MDAAPDASALAPFVDLEIVECEPSPGLLERAVAALLDDGVIAALADDPAAERLGLLRGVLAVGGDGLSLVAGAGDDGLVAGLALETVAARLVRALDAAVVLRRPAPAGLIGPDAQPAPPIADVGPAGFHAAGLDADAVRDERLDGALGAAGRLVTLLAQDAGKELPIVPEYANHTRGRAVLVPAGERALLVTGVRGLPQQVPTRRSWIGLLVLPDRTELLVWAGRAVEGGRRTLERAAEPGPDWRAVWRSPMRGVHGELAHPAVVALESSLGRTAMPEVPAELAEQAGWGEQQLAALASLAGRHGDDALRTRLVDAIGGPAELALFANGADAERQPGALALAPSDGRTALFDGAALAAKPVGRGWLARVERWWWDRPALATAWGVTLLLAAIGLGLATAVLGWSGWWWILWVAIGLEGLAMLLMRRLARRAREATDRAVSDPAGTDRSVTDRSVTDRSMTDA